MTRTLIVWGCSSGAGKSLVTTALCRLLANRGQRVAPFKAQNMSNNARVVPGLDGGFGEVGSAQYFQALAARALPQVDMNPVLLKPEGETASQVVLQGRVDTALSRMPWRERSRQLALAAQQSFERLATQFDCLVVEGAGSPAEINLAPQDYVNLGVARWARELGPTEALLVSDIDRGGAFAHCHGTWALLPDDLRPLLRGFLLNKFRGDASLLAPGPEDLQRLTGVPTIGVLPMLREHGLPDEDGLYAAPPARAGTALRIAVIAPPAISNLDEFQPLQALPGVQLVWVREPAALQGADWIILPGSKQVGGDLAWLRQRGFEAPLRAHATAGRPLLGICGGLQMLGRTLADPEGVDGAAYTSQPGLDLLPLHTRYAAPKRVRPGTARFAAPDGCWAALAGLPLAGYEIRCGETGSEREAVVHSDDGLAIGWQQGSVLGLYSHGLFESPAVQQALFGHSLPPLDDSLEGLAARLEEALDPETLKRWTT
jgi:adenosylcobyric acid synthase